MEIRHKFDCDKQVPVETHYDHNCDKESCRVDECPECGATVAACEK